MAKTRQRQDPDQKISYLISETGDNSFVIEIPASWKITFSSVNPGGGPHGERGHCVRLYEGEKQRGVFCNVVGFRDLSIPFARKIKRETGSANWQHDSDGAFSHSSRIRVDETLQLETEESPFESNGKS